MQKKLFLLISVLSFCVAAYGQGSDRRGGATEYKIAFASFAPLNLDIFIADADGSNAKPLLPSPAQDYNASFSSDGQWVVFTSTRNGLADIYRTRPDGSGLTRLTDHPAFDDQGALSPDGKWLAFVSSRDGQADIWLLELATKKLRNLTNQQKPKGGGDFRPSWSPDGKWLAFSSDRDSTKPIGAGGFTTRQVTELYVMRADGSEARRVTQAGAFAGSPVWSADGKQLLFYEASIEEVGNIVTARRFRGTSHIASLNLQTNERRTLTAGKGEKWSPQWLPQNRIAYCSGGPEGGLEYLTTNGEKSAGTRGEFRNPRWSPDGKRMIFHRDTDPNWPPFQPFASRDAQFKLIRTGVYPAASPDGNKLISNSEPGAIHHNKILIMNTDGSQRSVLLQDAEKSIVAPVWSPQGDKIAFGFGRFFQVFNGKVIGDVAVINSDGTGLQILTDGTGNNGFPSWSPDGKKIVFRSSGGASEGLFILDLATRAITPLLTNPQKDNFPAWSPRGDRIAFTRKRDGNYDIYTVKPDGSDLQRLTTTPGNDAHCVWSPDGEWLAFSSGRQGFKDESALYPYNAQPYGDLYVMRADGSDVRQLTDDQFEKATPGWIPPETAASDVTKLLPAEIITLLNQKYPASSQDNFPGWKLPEMDRSSLQGWKAIQPDAAHPAIAQGDFDGNGLRDYVVLLWYGTTSWNDNQRPPSPNTLVVAFLRQPAGYTLTELNAAGMYWPEHVDKTATGYRFLTVAQKGIRRFDWASGKSVVYDRDTLEAWVNQEAGSAYRNPAQKPVNNIVNYGVVTIRRSAKTNHSQPKRKSDQKQVKIK